MVHDSRSYAALVGDVIASRQTGNREDLQQYLESTMAIVNEAMAPIQPLMMTIGDEFQGLFDDVAAAMRASLRIRIGIRNRVDVRIGIGWGGLELVSEHPPFGQDGPCWWRARAAIGGVKRSESSNSVPRTVGTLARTDDGRESLLNSYLAARDHIVTGWDETDLEIAARMTHGVSQTAIAAEIGLSQSSVSRRMQKHGILSVLSYEPEDG